MNRYERIILHQILENQKLIISYFKHPAKECKEYDKTDKLLKEWNEERRRQNF